MVGGNNLCSPHVDHPGHASHASKTLSSSALRGRSPQTWQRTSLQASHLKALLASSVVGNTRGLTGTGSLPQAPGLLHFTSRHTWQVGHDGFVHAGLLQLRHNVACVELVALRMSLSENALLGKWPHLIHSNVGSTGPSPLHFKQLRLVPGAMMVCQ